jgi:Cupin domain
VSNRFMIDGGEADGRFALVQHLFEPSARRPMHRHHDEDEYTYVLSGRIGAVLGGEEVIGGPGDLIFKELAGSGHHPTSPPARRPQHPRTATGALSSSQRATGVNSSAPSPPAARSRAQTRQDSPVALPRRRGLAA